MDIVKADADMSDKLTVTGIGYENGVLQVQTCRGDFENADRHMELSLVDAEGNERYNDCSISWHEEVDGTQLSFDESYFLVEEADLPDIQLYGIYHIIDGCVNGNWQVTCALE